MRTAAQRSGDDAEIRVATRLEALGWRVLARQLRVGPAEIDQLAVDPRPPAQLVVEETVDGRKRARLHRAAFALRERGTLPDGAPLPALPLRFDLIVSEPGGRLRHHRHAA